jgi:hypothetical protein
MARGDPPQSRRRSLCFPKALDEHSVARRIAASSLIIKGKRCDMTAFGEKYCNDLLSNF